MVELLIDQTFTTKDIIARLQQAKRTAMVNKLFMNQIDLNAKIEDDGIDYCDDDVNDLYSMLDG